MSLEDLYKEIILDHYRNPRNRGSLPVPPATRVEGFNPLCGDEITLYLELDDGRISGLSLEGQGCSISQSSASLMSEAIQGASIDEAREKIAAFKEMMSIKEAELECGEDEAPAGTGSGADDDLMPGALGELEALKGVVQFPVRIKCATLSWNTLAQGLVEAEAGGGSSTRFVEDDDGVSG